MPEKRSCGIVEIACNACLSAKQPQRTDLSDSLNAESWGRVDETNTVFVRDGATERKVGQYPDGTAEEALAYFVRKFNDLAGQVSLLEQRIIRGTAGSEATKTVEHLNDQLKEPSVVGDIQSLRDRVDALSEKVTVLSEQQRAEKAEAREEALAKRTAIVEEAETLAAQDLHAVQWKQLSAQIETLFQRWQEEQKTGPHLPKTQADELWKRFRKARQTIDTARRSFFAQMDATNKDVRARKQALIREAEALAPRGAAGVPAYRELLDKWKQAGHASRKLDDQLWTQFKAAGDVLYAAKSEEDTKLDEEYGGNLELKLALLAEAEPILQESDHAVARDRLLQIQKKWDAIGKVPRASIRDVEGRLKKLEDHVRSLHDAHWKATNPETVARAEGLRGQLERSISELEAQLAQATEAGDQKNIAEAESALATQRSWLNALGTE